MKRTDQIPGNSDARMWRMLFAGTKLVHEGVGFDKMVSEGGDEINRRKSQNYLAVFASLMAKRVLFATAGKDSSFWDAFFEELLRHNGHSKAIQHVAIDMIAAYIKAVVDHFGNALVVYEKFHVIQSVLVACDIVSKAVSWSDAGKRDRLERTRWMWLNPVNWTEKQALKRESVAMDQRVNGMA